jgi:hypothetical protein
VRALRFPRLTPARKYTSEQRFTLKVVRGVVEKVNKKYHKKSADGVYILYSKDLRQDWHRTY